MFCFSKKRVVLLLILVALLSLFFYSSNGGNYIVSKNLESNPPALAPLIDSYNSFEPVLISSFSDNSFYQDDADGVIREYLKTQHGLESDNYLNIRQITREIDSREITNIDYVQEYGGIPVINGKSHVLSSNEAGGTIHYFKDRSVSEEVLSKVEIENILSLDQIKDLFSNVLEEEILYMKPIYDYTNDGLGIMISSDGRNAKSVYVLEIVLRERINPYSVAYVERSYIYVIDAITGNAVYRDLHDHHIPVTGQVDSYHHLATQTSSQIPKPFEKQRVDVYDFSGTSLITSVFTDSTGEFNLELDPGTYLLRYVFASYKFYLEKQPEVQEDDSVYEVQVVVPSSGQLTVPPLYWPDYEISHWHPALAESNVYYHVQDLFDIFVEDVGYSFLEQELDPALVRFVDGEVSSSQCTRASANSHIITLSYRTSGFFPSTGSYCNAVFNERTIRHELAHTLGFRMGLWSGPERNPEFAVGFPYQHHSKKWSRNSIHEGQADYWGVGTSEGSVGWPSSADYLDYYAEDEYDAHTFGRVITLGGRDIDNAIGVDESRILYAETMRMNPLTMHEFVEFFVANDETLYGGANVEDICEVFGDDYHVVTDSCFEHINDNAIKSDNEHVLYMNRPESNQLTLQFDVSPESQEYRIAIAPITSTSYSTLYDSPSFSSCVDCNDLTYDLDLSAFPDGLYKIRYSSREGSNWYYYKTLLGISPFHEGYPVDVSQRVSGKTISLVDINGDSLPDPIFPVEQIQSLEFTKIFAFDNSGDLLDGFPALYGDGTIGNNDRPVHVFTNDFDGDSIMEIAAVTEGTVAFHNLNGDFIEGRQFGIGPGEVYNVELSDFNLDGIPEIVTHTRASSTTGITRIYNADGSIFFEPGGFSFFLASYGGGAIVDLFGTPEPELVVGTRDGEVRVYDSINEQILLSVPVSSQAIQTKPAVGDIDGDGDQEIVINAAGTIVTVELDGTFNTFGSVSLTSDVALGDVDGDGDLEIYASDWNKIKGFEHDGVGVINPDGGGYSPVPSIRLDSNGFGSGGDGGDLHVENCRLEGQSPVIGDIDGDGDQEIIVNSNAICPYVFAYDHEGNFVNNWPKAVDYSFKQCQCSPIPCGCDPSDVGSALQPSPMIVNFDDDPFVEVVVPSQNKLYVFDEIGIYDESKIDWGMFGHDSWHTGNSNFIVPSQSPTCDVDEDGFEGVVCGGHDCDDSNPDVYPGAAEICGDGIDNQCNGDVGFGDVDCDDSLCSTDPLCAVCTLGQTQGCTTLLEGLCSYGVEACTSFGQWGTCSAGSLVSCDGVDQTCTSGLCCTINDASWSEQTIDIIDSVNLMASFSSCDSSGGVEFEIYRDPHIGSDILEHSEIVAYISGTETVSLNYNPQEAVDYSQGYAVPMRYYFVAKMTAQPSAILVSSHLEVSTSFCDSDGDGHYVINPCQGLDCDDSNPDVYPGAAEICGDGIDNQCNGDVGFGDVDCDDASCSTDDECSVDCVFDSDCEIIECATATCNLGSCNYASTIGEVCNDGIVCGEGICGGPGGFFCQGIQTVDCDLPECSLDPQCESPGFVCGDGIIQDGEQCDDGCGSDGVCDHLADNYDGCDFLCQIEPGWSCVGEPSVCIPIVGFCDDDLDCDSSAPYCDLLNNLCVECFIDSDCEDLNECSVDQCISGTCSHSPIGEGVSCSDGDWCNGEEICSVLGLCSSGSSQCGGSEVCDDSVDMCVDGIDVSFSSDVSVVQNGDQLVFSAEVNCNFADCGDIDLTLDPEEEKSFKISTFIKNIFS